MADNQTGNGIVAFLLGGVIGTVAGLILAPRSGQETRERLAEWLEDRREKTREFFDKEKDKLHHKREQISAAVDAAQKAYREADRA